MATQYMPAQVPSYHGYSSQQPRYDSSAMYGKNGGFAFRKRFERLDWRKIAAVDVDQISRTLDFNSLQENVMNITFCNIETEVDVRMVDPNFIKVFRLAQLIIEYLLHSQDYLAGLVAANEEKMKAEKQIQNELQQQIDKLKQELADVRKESHKRKKLLIAQQQLIHSGSDSYNKCPYCAKAFLNNSFLQSHITRRHGGSRPHSGSDDLALDNRRLTTRVYELEEQLRVSVMQQAGRTRVDSSLNNSGKPIVLMKDAEVQIEAYESDDKEKDRHIQLLRKELTESREQNRSYERTIAELRHGKWSNLGDMEDDVESEVSPYKQQSDVAVLNKQFKHQVEDMQMKMNQKDRKLKKMMQQMTASHQEDVKRLTNALEVTSHKLATTGRAMSPEMKEQQEHVEELIRESREIEKLLGSQEETLLQEMTKPVEAPVMPFQAPKSPRRAASPRHLSMVPSDEDDDSTTFATATHTGSLGVTGKEGTQSTLGSTLGEMPLGTAEFLDQLHGNNALTLLRQQYATELQERIIRQGISHDRLLISRQILENKLQMMHTQRQSYMKKYVDFMALRNHFDELSTRRAKEQLRMQKRSPRPGNPNPLSASSPPVMPSPHHGRHTQGFSHPATSVGNVNHLTAGHYGQKNTPAGNPAIRVTSPDGPRPAPRSASPTKTLHSTGSTTEWTSTNWDSDDDDSEQNDYNQIRGTTPLAVGRLSPSSATDPRASGRPRSPTPASGRPRSPTPASGRPRSPTRASGRPKSPTPTPSPRPRPRAQPTLIKSKPLRDFSDDDDDDDDDEDDDDYFDRVSPRKAATQPQPSDRKLIMSVPKMAQSIELQLNGRNEKRKPVGGVDTVKTSKSPKKQAADILEDLENSDFLISSDEEKLPPKRPATRQSHVETDFSTNTYGTSAWGSSSKVASSVDPAGEKKHAARNSFTDVSEDEELNLENI